MRAINPAVCIDARNEFVIPEEASDLLARHANCSFVVDCIDSVEPKVHLISAALRRGVRVVSAMGAGGKTDPSQVKVRTQRISLFVSHPSELRAAIAQALCRSFTQLVYTAGVQVADLVNTHNDRFARLLRKNLRRDRVRGEVTVVFSPELAAPGSMREVPAADASKFKRSYYGTMSYMPAVFGMHAAAYVIGEIAGVNRMRVSRKRRNMGGVAPGTQPNPPRIVPKKARHAGRADVHQQDAVAASCLGLAAAQAKDARQRKQHSACAQAHGAEGCIQQGSGDVHVERNTVCMSESVLAGSRCQHANGSAFEGVEGARAIRPGEQERSGAADNERIEGTPHRHKRPAASAAAHCAQPDADIPEGYMYHI